MTLRAVLVCVVVLGPFLVTGEPLNCYVCSGLQEPSCNDPFRAKDEFKKPCTAASCFRMMVSNESFKNVTMRTCGPPVWEKLTDVPLGRSYSKSTFNCTWDYCNHSNTVRGSSLLLLAVLAISLH